MTVVIVWLFCLVHFISAQCPTGWQPFGERCFYLSTEEGSWAYGMKRCTEMGGNLAAIDNLDLQLFITQLINGTNKQSQITLNTGNDYVYHYVHDLGVDVTNHASIAFTVQACNDAHIALSEAKGLDERETYEIVLGGWADSQSVIRDCKQCEHKDEVRHSSHPLDCNVAHPFWISWSNNYLKVGTGLSVGDNQFMSWNDTDPHRVGFAAVATGWGTTGVWTFLLNTFRSGKFWIGATDLAAENDWLWLPSQSYISEFTDWATGEPNNNGGYEHCMVMDMNENCQWRDDVCEESRNFICEMQMENTGIVG